MAIQYYLGPILGLLCMVGGKTNSLTFVLWPQYCQSVNMFVRELVTVTEVTLRRVHYKGSLGL